MKYTQFTEILHQQLIQQKSTTAFQIYLEKKLIFSFPKETNTSKFAIVLNNKGWDALKSLNETKIAEAYIDSNIEITGDLLEAFELRSLLGRKNWFFNLWNVHIYPLIFGQITSDRKWIASHYDHGDELYLNFLDQTRTYSQGIFENENETLETAMLRKHQYAFDKCNLKPGQEVLDIGGGWGSFLEFAGKKGVRITSITISKDSQAYLNRIVQEYNLPCKVQNSHFLEFKTEKKFDAIINMGVTEHLPNYSKTLSKYTELLKPNGKIYLDASASDNKFDFSTYINKYIYPGNPSPLCLADYLKHLASYPLELEELINDGNNYYLTAKKWCQNLERNKDTIANKYPSLYRIFELYLYGTAHAFKTKSMTAYRMILSLPS